jgi:hypothetical protein
MKGFELARYAVRLLVTSPSTGLHPWKEWVANNNTLHRTEGPAVLSGLTGTWFDNGNTLKNVKRN